MSKKSAFTLIELVFVIVIMGIIGKFGTEFLAQAYKSFISTTLQNKFQNQSSMAVAFIAKRLQYRIKNSVIVRDIGTDDFQLLEGFAPATGYNILEWISYDADDLRYATWSGIYSKHKSGVELYSPETNTSAISALVASLAYKSSPHLNISDTAIYFIGSDSSKDSWGWDGVKINNMSNSIIPVKAGANIKQFASNVATGNFNSLNLKNKKLNSYQLSWTANAIIFDSANQQLWFYSDYRPWKGEKYTDAKNKQLIMEDISDFRKKQSKDIITIKVCSSNEKLKDLDEGNFLTCTEKTIL